MEGRGKRSQHPKVCRISNTPDARCRGATGQIVFANRLASMRKFIAAAMACELLTQAQGLLRSGSGKPVWLRGRIGHGRSGARQSR